ncbi:MAG: M14 family zinc carboxypeptidase [Bacteroidota bacterium]
MRIIVASIIIFAIGIVNANVYAQNELSKANSYLENKGEVYFTFNINNKEELKILTKIISIDNVKGNSVWAYANKLDFQKFSDLNINYTVLNHPGDLQVEPKMFDNFDKATNAWDAYPTYSGYLSMMAQFETSYPSLCKIVQVGTTKENRKILFAKISDNKDIREQEPRVLVISAIHGDEPTGSVTVLRMIDYLLSNYATNNKIATLINNSEIWVCPFANPDGTWSGGNNSINNATRGNANNIDINRNFPNPTGGLHPDNNAWQPETTIFMNLLDSLHFTLSINYHGGSEVVNYPFDSWISSDKTHADDNWWQTVSKMYADTAKQNSSSYMTNVIGSGYINGGDWYVVEGSYQDYANYYAQCRDVTLEISASKTVNAAILPTYWNYNYKSLFNYIQQSLYGIHGVVTDACTGSPIRAKIEILSHDRDSSHVFSASDLGDYYRPIAPGTYSMKVTASGYPAKTINGIIVNSNSTTLVNVQLSCATSLSDNNIIENIVYPNPFTDEIIINQYSINLEKIVVYSVEGKELYRNNNTKELNKINTKNWEAGIYFLKLISKSDSRIIRLVKQ